MSVDFDPVTPVRKSEHDLEDFLTRVPRMERERAEVRVEKSLGQFRAARAVTLSHLLTTASVPSEMEIALRQLQGHQESEITRTRREELAYWMTTNKINRNAWMNDVFPVASEEKPASTVSTGGVGTGTSAETHVVSVGRLHAWFWSGLVLGALIWGILAGASIFAGVGLSPTVATFGVLGTVALAATMFALSVQDVVRRHER